MMEHNIVVFSDKLINNYSCSDACLCERLSIAYGCASFVLAHSLSFEICDTLKVVTFIYCHIQRKPKAAVYSLKLRTDQH